MDAENTVIGKPEEKTKTRLLRYSIIDGVRTLKDSQLAQVFERAKEEGILAWVMYSENVNTMTGRDLTEYYKDKSRMLFLIFWDGKIAGWTWLDDFGHRTARIHFGFFKWLTRERLTVQVAQDLLWELLNMKFRGGTSLRVIRGETPAFNRLAIRFIQKVGLKVVGETPFAAYRYTTDTSDSIIHSYITKDLLADHMSLHTSVIPQCISGLTEARGPLDDRGQSNGSPLEKFKSDKDSAHQTLSENNTDRHRAHI